MVVYSAKKQVYMTGALYQVLWSHLATLCEEKTEMYIQVNHLYFLSELTVCMPCV